MDTTELPAQPSLDTGFPGINAMLATRVMGKFPMRASVHDRKPVPSWQAIRFVCDPEQNLCPDIFTKLPGRGAWINADRQAVERALRKNMFMKSLNVKCDAKAAIDLIARITKLLMQASLSSISVARRANAAISGFHNVEKLFASDEPALLIIAKNSSDQSQKLKKIINAKQRDNQLVGWLEAFTSQQLGEPFGKPDANYVCVKTKPFIRAVLQHAGRHNMLCTGARS